MRIHAKTQPKVFGREALYGQGVGVYFDAFLRADALKSIAVVKQAETQARESQLHSKGGLSETLALRDSAELLSIKGRNKNKKQNYRWQLTPFDPEILTVLSQKWGTWTSLVGPKRGVWMGTKKFTLEMFLCIFCPLNNWSTSSTRIIWSLLFACLRSKSPPPP